LVFGPILTFRKLLILHCARRGKNAKTPALILLFHRLTCFDLPARMVGQLRTKEIWLADREGKKATHAQPPPPDEVRDRLVRLCDAWNQSFASLRSKAPKLEALARFHAELLLIHPFLDGNGRCARAILMQQCLDLFGRAEMTLMKKGADYYQALRLADRGDYAELAALIDPIVYG
jgi:Fic family protein